MYIARQPIFNRGLNVYGYELLYRANKKSTKYTGTSSMSATATVLYGIFEIGIEKIVDKKRSFVNFDYDFIVSDAIELLDPDNVVIEVLEDINVDHILIERLKYLKNKGYKIALDDFLEEYDRYPLVPVSDIIKYDIMATPLNTIKNEVKQAISENKILLAEKVETREDFIEAEKMGFHLFQGYFFSKPTIIGKSSEKQTRKMQYMELINELRQEEPSYQRLSEMMEKDAGMSYSLLKFIGSRKSKDPVYSIKRALVKMGFKEIEIWVNMLMMRDLSDGKPKELTRTSLIRSKFAQYIAINSKFKQRNLEATMMGLFSVLDALLDLEMERALNGLVVTGDVREALIYKTGRLSELYKLVLTYENGKWDEVPNICENVGIDEKILSKGYLESIDWAEESMTSMNS